jgi:hypothetical protein
MKETPGYWWVQVLLRPVLVAGMLVCLLAPISGIAEYLISGWHGPSFLVFAVFAALEGILSERALRRRRITGTSYLISRVAEVLVLLLLLRLVRYIPLGLDQLWADALLWPSNAGLFFDGLFLYMSLVFVPMWIGALNVAQLLGRLDVGKGKGPPPADKTSIEYYMWLTSPSPAQERQEGLDQLAGLFLSGGIALLVASAAIYGWLPSVRIPAIPILIYFALGLALLSQGRFSVLHAGWETQEVSIQPGIARRWLPWVVIFCGGVALLAWLLPTNYAMGPIRALLTLSGLLIGLIYQLLLFIFGLFMMLLYWLLSPFFPDMEAPPRPSFEPMVPLTTPEQAADGGPATVPELLFTALFWIAIIAIAGYMLYRFAWDRISPLAEVEEAEETRLGQFLRWLRTLWQRWRDWRKEVQVQMRQRRARAKAEQRPRIRTPRFLSLRRLSPRQLIRYFYLSAERRAAQAGQERRPHQTPYEYRADLEKRFPDLEEDVEGLTEAFVAAQYDHRPVVEEDAAAAKPFWQRIKAALRRRRIGS